MGTLHQALVKAGQWQDGDCKRGQQQVLYQGHWTEQGHAVHGRDKLHDAGSKTKKRKARGGKAIPKKLVVIKNQELWDQVTPLGERVTEQVQKYRPDIYYPLVDTSLHCSNFGIFTLFMAATFRFPQGHWRFPISSFRGPHSSLYSGRGFGFQGSKNYLQLEGGRHSNYGQ
jgi:hypothetical protein